LRTKNRTNKLIERAGPVIGLNPDVLEVTVEKRISWKLKMGLMLVWLVANQFTYWDQSIIQVRM